MTKKKTSQMSGRPLSQNVRTAKGRKISSQLWLKRQLNDPYVAQAKTLGYRSRAAFKLLQMNEKFHILTPGSIVVDLGAAPGGWTQVAVQEVCLREKKGQVVGIDLTPIGPIEHAVLLVGDFLDPMNQSHLKDVISGPVAVVLSDMASSPTGHSQTDHLRTLALAEEAFEFAKEQLKEGGSFVTKILRGGTENQFFAELKKHFDRVAAFKPPASRSDSAEIYYVCLGFHQ